MSADTPKESEQTLKRRLEKALTVGEKLKKKQVFESEVNKELAKRNEILKKEHTAYEEKLAVIRSTVSKLDEQLQPLFELLLTTDACEQRDVSVA